MNKFKSLYNKVSCEKQEMNGVMSKADTLAMEECMSNKCRGCHCINLERVNSGCDGVTGWSRDHVRNTTALSNSHLSLLLSCMLKHGYVPETMGLRTQLFLCLKKKQTKKITQNMNQNMF